jgi:hypothetical protein
MVIILLVAGCTNTTVSPAPVSTTPVTAAVTTAVPEPPASTPAAPPATTSPVPGQPAPLHPSLTSDASLSSYILMDSTTLIPGEVGSFHIYNHGPGSLRCSTTDPSYAVFARMKNGTWNGTSIAAFPSNRTDPLALIVGDSSRPYRFVTAGWNPGHYQLVLNCEANGQYIFHDFDVMKKPEVLVFN